MKSFVKAVVSAMAVAVPCAHGLKAGAEERRHGEEAEELESSVDSDAGPTKHTDTETRFRPSASTQRTHDEVALRALAVMNMRKEGNPGWWQVNRVHEFLGSYHASPTDIAELKKFFQRRQNPNYERSYYDPLPFRPSPVSGYGYGLSVAEFLMGSGMAAAGMQNEDGSKGKRFTKQGRCELESVQPVAGGKRTNISGEVRTNILVRFAWRCGSVRFETEFQILTDFRPLSDSSWKGETRAWMFVRWGNSCRSVPHPWRKMTFSEIPKILYRGLDLENSDSTSKSEGKTVGWREGWRRENRGRPFIAVGWREETRVSIPGMVMVYVGGEEGEEAD